MTNGKAHEGKRERIFLSAANSNIFNFKLENSRFSDFAINNSVKLSRFRNKFEKIGGKITHI